MEAIHVEINQGSFSLPQDPDFPLVTVVEDDLQVLVACTCSKGKEKLCRHGALVLTAIITRESFLLYYHKKKRLEVLKKFAAEYGLENETELENYFQIVLEDKKLLIKPRLPGLLSVTKESLSQLRKDIATQVVEPSSNAMNAGEESLYVVLRKHRYYSHLVIELYSAQSTKEGKPKNPLKPVNPMTLVWESEHADHIKFFSALAKFQSASSEKRSLADIQALKAILKNPLAYAFYVHDETNSGNTTASTLQKIDLKILAQQLVLSIEHELPFYKLSGKIELSNTEHLLKDLIIKFSYFIYADNTLYLIDKPEVLSAIELFTKNKGDILIHASKYEIFKTQVLKELGDKIALDYKYIQAASSLQIEENGFDKTPEKFLYLTDFGNYVLLTPVIKYGQVEIPIRSKRLIYGEDSKGNEFRLERDEESELHFIAFLSLLHPDFKEQVTDDMSYFCLHKTHFLNEDWFLNVCEEWTNYGISVFGFNAIEELKLNPNKVKIDIKIISGINWFNAVVDARFGKKKVSVKLIQKAIRKKSKYIELGDGTLGILPQAWIERFTEYFNAAEVLDGSTLQIPKTNFALIEELFEEDEVNEEVKKEINFYKEKLNDFKNIEEIEVPGDLKATLRPYQKQGLNWLNFLDDFNFGGCLADDMGLGKSVQIIAFILSQKTKRKNATNLLVVPTTLIFNWQAEFQKFAPCLQVRTLYGAERDKSARELDKYDVVLTSYTTLLSDISFLKDTTFNYIFLDESQAIKNPETQRYKSVRLLRSRNKIVITGTPIENNTFDLYGQFSFACPGLLGSKRYFREVYAMPIDKFKSSKRARELQAKIQPFLLRRTKEQVASDLPEKLETILYCEMKEEQFSIYKTYEKEFRDYVAATDNEDLRKSAMNVLKGLTKLRQIADSPALLPDGNLTMKGPSSKIELLMQQLEAKAPHHKILVFSQFVGMLDLIKKELDTRAITYAYLTGSTRNRKEVVDKFQKDTSVRVFLISLKAGGTGLNLTEADCVYLVDPWWNPAVENQAIDRSHRIGQNKMVHAIRLICPGTVEEKMMLMQESKKELSDDLVKTDSGFISSLSKKELLTLFS
ncbi:DNA helicase [Sphingobacteriaceae bacterium]|nr:DNA helicase [Sphingobacteriaceae bacterium]